MIPTFSVSLLPLPTFITTSSLTMISFGDIRMPLTESIIVVVCAGTDLFLVFAILRVCDSPTVSISSLSVLISVNIVYDRLVKLDAVNEVIPVVTNPVRLSARVYSFSKRLVSL